MGKTWRRIDKDGYHHDVKGDREREDDFRNRRHTREVQEPEIDYDNVVVTPRNNNKFDKYKNIRV